MSAHAPALRLKSDASVAQSWRMSVTTRPQAKRERRVLPPLDGPALDRMALRYVERFATTRGRLTDYLKRKIRERGWDGATVDPRAVAERMAELGYVDDRAYAEARASAMTRRGLGARRIAGAFHQAGIDEADRQAVAPASAESAGSAALAFARRRRLGPWASEVPDKATAQRQIAAMLRAGHRFDLARRIVAMLPGDMADPDNFDQDRQ
jgi:regulatory protein